MSPPSEHARKVHAGHKGLDAWSTARYRVYPPKARARSFGHLHVAIGFARKCSLAAGLANERVGIVRGTGSDYHAVGHCDATGWHPAAGYEEVRYGY
jgi:hypothetical protein